jgi:predicted DNA-binding protein YlxM (UPF0122 family)
MPYLTVAEYAKLKNISRQAVEERISRGTLPAVLRSVKVKRKMVVVNAEEVEALARMQGEA